MRRRFNLSASKQVGTMPRKIKIVCILIMITPLILYGILAHRDKEYGLNTPTSLGWLARSPVIAIGEVVSTKARIRPDTIYKEPLHIGYHVHTLVKLRVFEDLKGYWDKDTLYMKVAGGPITIGEIKRQGSFLAKGWPEFYYYFLIQRPDEDTMTRFVEDMTALFSVGETVLVFLDTSVYCEFDRKIFGQVCADTLVLLSEFGKFVIRNDTVKYWEEDYPGLPLAGVYGLHIDLAKDLIRAAIRYPDVVDAKIDTLYEEAKSLYKSTDDVEQVKEFVLEKLHEIAELVR